MQIVAYHDRVSVVLFIITANPAGDTSRDATDGVSMRSFVSSKVGSPQPGDDDTGEGLHLIKYVMRSHAVYEYPFKHLSTNLNLILL